MSNRANAAQRARSAAFATALLFAAPFGAGTQASPASFPLACSFGSQTAGLDTSDHCANETAAGLQISPVVRSAFAYDHGLASVAVAGRGWFYLTRDGRSMRMMTFDNGPDYFRDGLARALVDGKLAYVDRHLRFSCAPVIPLP